MFQKQMRVMSMHTFWIVVVNSLVNFSAEIFLFLAVSLGSVALVSAVNGIQPFIVLVYGLILTLFFPHIIKEDINKETIFIKIISAVILFIGIYYISV